MGQDKFKVYYCRWQSGVKEKVGFWENLTKTFDSEKDADLFINRIKDNVIVKWYTKSKDFSSSSHG